MQNETPLSRYDIRQTYEWNYRRAPEPVACDVPPVAGDWSLCGLPVDSPLGIPAGPLLNGRWVLYYASLGFDVLTYKTFRSTERECYPLPNLQPVDCGQLAGGEQELKSVAKMDGSWAVSFGMPSKTPNVWREDVEETRHKLPPGKLLSVSVVGTVQDGWSIDDLAADYAQCARWAVESGADLIETNFSCPNVSTCDGQLYQQPRDMATVAGAVRQAIGPVPYIIKVGHVTSETEAGTLLDAVGATIDAVAMTNSIATTVRAEDGLLFDGQRRGICGDATRKASTAQVALFARLLRERGSDVELIGVGGAGTAAHLRDYLSAGASAVQLATAAMVDPHVAIEIRRELATGKPLQVAT